VRDKDQILLEKTYQNILLNEYKHIINNSFACEHCNKGLKFSEIIIGKHMYPIGQLFVCDCQKSKIFTNTIRDVNNFLQYVEGNKSEYYNGFCNDKRCGNCFNYIQTLRNGVSVPYKMEINKGSSFSLADRFGCPKCPDNQNILKIGGTPALLPEGDKTNEYFIDFYRKHKNEVENLYKKLK